MTGRNGSRGPIRRSLQRSLSVHAELIRHPGFLTTFPRPEAYGGGISHRRERTGHLVPHPHPVD
ncbi:hypothetical protein ACFFX0_26150 [Citricoccus parietis]|uniref:Uncharacterized protein n=1 Tax=Citricoccus parietis TaxID=592307 RepID=A0ABV5G6B7_9MICC